jgi:hypothetical protein
MIEELNKSTASISSYIKGLQHQAEGLDKALPKLVDNQATLLSMSAEKTTRTTCNGYEFY